jgi:HAD superfamily hydrolase (TIGR01484 family)
MTTMQPLSTFSRDARRKIKVVLTDIDDTLTEDGRLPAVAYTALEDLQKAGFIVAPITGRPAGWCDLIARQWPVHGVVGENGAFYFRYDDATKTLTRRYAKTAEERAADKRNIVQIRDAVLAEVPGAAVAADQAYREADLAIDFCEDVPALDKADVQRIVGVFDRFGATAKVSSIHVNGWFGGYDKLSTTRLFLKECFDIDIERDKDAVVFSGDSPNDAPMFGFFPASVGVANVLDFRGDLAHFPAFVTQGRAARGFAELAKALIEAKG